MSVKITMPGTVFRKCAQSQDVVEVNGNTVGECLEDLGTQFPDIKQQLCQKSGKLLLNEIHIFVNAEILYPSDLDKPVKDGGKLFLLFAFLGG